MSQWPLPCLHGHPFLHQGDKTFPNSNFNQKMAELLKVTSFPQQSRQQLTS
jgi:hypothetical protein